MRRILFVISALFLLLLPFGCKTTEANYKKAYDRAKDNVHLQGGDDSTVYTQYRREATTTKVAVDGDTLAFRTDYLMAIADNGKPAPRMGQYNVAVGRFKQIFNARSQRDRLIAQGRYPGAFIAQTREPMYYVIAATAPTVADLMPEYHRILADTLHLPKGMPQLLKSAVRVW